MAAITLSSGVRQNLASLQSTSALQSLTQSRLATGKKVNSALDNPTSFFTASGLSNRANDLNSLLDNMGQAVKTIEAADKGLKAVQKLVENAQSLANQAKATTGSKAAVSAASAVAMVKTGSATPDNTAIGAATSIDLTVDGTTTSIDVSTATDMTSLLGLINGANTGVTASASSGSIVLTHDTAGATGRSISVGGASATSLFGTLSDTTAGADVVEASSAVSADSKRASLAADFEKIRTQINELVADSGYNGVNLLQGQNLTVKFNEKANGSSYQIEGKQSDTAAAGLGIDAAANNWGADADVNAALDDLTAAINEIRTSASSFGASLSIVQNRQDFTKGMIDTLNNGADELVNADVNQEAANLLSLQTRAQLANTALSMAAQQDAAVMRLF
jgi:flagellin